MFDDVKDTVHLGLWAAAGLAVLLAAGVIGGLWVHEWQQARGSKAASLPLVAHMAAKAAVSNAAP
jgi:hypothetical protein